MKNKLQLGAGIATLSALALLQSAQASMIHRYSFGEAAGASTVKDSVGTADGVIKGNGSAFSGTGKLSIFGGGGSGAAPEAIAGYVDLPNHMFNILTNVTFETWVTWDDEFGGAAGATWPRIFDFGTSSGGEDVSNGDGNYLFLSPKGDANIRFAVRDPATGAEPAQATGPGPLEAGVEVCLTVTYDTDANVSRLYSNGVLVASSAAPVALKTINDVNNWLGRSQWNDPMFTGTYNEFRVYDNALNPVEVAASFISGPDKPSTDAALVGPIQAVHLSVAKLEMTEQDKQKTSATVDYEKAAGLPLAGMPGVTYESDKPAVLTVSSTGELTAVAPGTAKVTLSYSGKTDSATLTVNARQSGLVTAGTLYVDLRAADLKSATDTSIWLNRAGTGDFTSSGEAIYTANVAGSGIAGIEFPTATATFTGPTTTSDLEGNSDCSIEVWAYNPTIADEETLVAWSHRGGGDGSNMSFNYGANATWGAVGHWGSPDMGWDGTPAAGKWHYLVYTYNGANTARVYADGGLKYEEVFSNPLAIHPGNVIRVGAQSVQAGDAADPGQAFTGYISLVRVHGGEMSANDVANNYLFGPSLVDPGALEGITMTLSYETLYGPRDYSQATVTANYANLKNLAATDLSTYASSDPAIVTVNSKGAIVAVKEGSATITATYKGKTATKTVTVVAPPALTLKHRYSFSEATGASTTKDSAGTADGVIKGNGASFDGSGQLSLPGGTASGADPGTIAGYVDLPNGIISALHNATFESWVTWEGSGAWQRIFDFGTSDQGEDISSGNGAYFFLCPQSGPGFLHFSVRDPVTAQEPSPLVGKTALGINSEVYLAVTYDFSANVSMMYSNAVLVATNLTSTAPKAIADVNNWLGRSQWGDNMFQGKFNEFRIWEGALSADQVAANYTAGPNTVPDVTPANVSLGIALSGASVKISWPNTVTGFALQSSLVLGTGASWTAVDTSSAVDQGGMKVLTVPVSGAAQYFRLKK